MQLQNSSSKPNPELQPADTATSVKAIEAWLATKLAKQLRLDVKTLSVHEPLTRYGLDSIDAVTLVGDLEDWLGLELPSTLLWDYPTIEKASQYLVKDFDISAALAPGSESNSEQSDAPDAPAKTQGWGNLWRQISGS
ncbi:acyl carrier protein [Leptolyngbya sp. FACHB-261]|uniref:acyl carrier protein n=1 Tax=Leptolyngbya sp. FACHB-261 TaxID=2692806 RepID=UPI0016888424|nr:acyl carrier protein [Leptolyngbya sp. FACHB-261]MBD2102744.1 acyl carrier protein [Leptolyngbya sp. FACHB-261]